MLQIFCAKGFASGAEVRSSGLKIRYPPILYVLLYLAKAKTIKNALKKIPTNKTVVSQGNDAVLVIPSFFTLFFSFFIPCKSLCFALLTAMHLHLCRLIS